MFEFIVILLKVIICLIGILLLSPFITLVGEYSKSTKCIALNGEEDYLYRPKSKNRYSIKFVATRYLHELREILLSIIKQNT